MNTEMQKKALAARDAHMALLDLKRFIDEAARTTHDAELEAVHLAISAKPGYSRFPMSARAPSG
jgi:hypothetical protein